MTPRQFAHHAICSAISAVAEHTTPPITSECPLRYLVEDCTTASAPNPMGRCSTGEQNVLSATMSPPPACVASASAARSLMASKGFEGVSTQVSAGDSARTVAAASDAARSTSRRSKPTRRDSASSSRHVPP